MSTNLASKYRTTLLVVCLMTLLEPSCLSYCAEERVPYPPNPPLRVLHAEPPGSSGSIATASGGSPSALAIGRSSNIGLPSAAGDEAPAVDGVSNLVGSKSILERCWTPTELSGVPEDRRPKKMSKSTLRQPPVSPGQTSANLPPLDSTLYNSIRSVAIPANGPKLLALTFDLCEANGEVSGYDYAIIHYLRANSVKATFFAGGKWMQSHPVRTQQLMVDPLFEIGNHSWSHAHFALLDEAEIQREILGTQAEYQLLWEDLRSKSCAQGPGSGQMDKIPRSPRLFRFPYGTCSPEALNAVNQAGLAAIQWSVVTGDAARSQTGAGIAAAVLRQVRPGAIVIAHANGRGHGTAEALTHFVPELRSRGYQFVTVSELLASGKPVSATACYENKPNDNRRYDTKAVKKMR